MKPRLRWIAAAVSICALAGAGYCWLRARELRPEALLRRMPARGALVAYVDLQTLRKGGVMQMIENSRTPEDREYTDFVRRTGFDYKRDLDAAMISFAPAGKYMLLRGRFNWSKLKEYAASAEGECDATMCRMTGSHADQSISFFLLRPDLLALAVSQDDGAALRLRQSDDAADAAVPAAPLWLRFAPSSVSSNADLPEGARVFAGAMKRADSVTLAFAPEAARIAAKLEIHCQQAGDAAEVASQLTKLTATIREGLEPAGRADANGLAATLAAGAFRAEGAKVVGGWTIEKALLEKALGGQ
jgi:hypothetical protein